MHCTPFMYTMFRDNYISTKHKKNKRSLCVLLKNCYLLNSHFHHLESRYWELWGPLESVVVRGK